MTDKPQSMDQAIEDAKSLANSMGHTALEHLDDVEDIALLLTKALDQKAASAPVFLVALVNVLAREIFVTAKCVAPSAAGFAAGIKQPTVSDVTNATMIMLTEAVHHAAATAIEPAIERGLHSVN